MNATASTSNTVTTVIALIVFNINVYLTSSSSLHFNVVRHLFREVATLCCPRLLLDPAFHTRLRSGTITAVPGAYDVRLN